MVVTGYKILTFRSRTIKVLRLSFLNLEIFCDYGSIGFEVLKKGYKIQYFCVYKDQNKSLQQLQAYEAGRSSAQPKNHETNLLVIVNARWKQCVGSNCP